MQILICGMHRSGTSMVARLLNMLGVYFAPEGVSTGANQENPKGFWERRDVRALNDLLLHSADADWHRLSDFSLERVPEPALAQFKKEAGKIILAMDAHRPWFLKEPRFCLLAPLWLELLELPLCLLVYRSPLEVARSLEMRNGFSPPFGLALWERYNIAFLNAIRGQRRLQVNHADLMSEPLTTTRRLEEELKELGVVGLRSPSEEEILAFIDPLLYRAREKEIAGQRNLTIAQRTLSNALQSGKALFSTKPARFSDSAQAVLASEDARACEREEMAALQEKNAAFSSEMAKLTGEQEQAALRAAKAAAAEKELTGKLRAMTAARDEASQRALNADELRQTIQQEMKLLRRAATADATNAELQTRKTAIDRLARELEARAAALAESRGQISHGNAKLEGRTQELLRATSRLSAGQVEAVKLRASNDRLRQAFAESRARGAELSAQNRVLKQGLKKIEKSFERLRRSRSFRFMVYTARRFGLVSRTPRNCIEEIKKCFPEIRRALKAVKSAPVPEVPPEERRKPPAPAFVPLREFDHESVERIGRQLAASVSIIIPVFNSPEELRRCLESVFSHTRGPFEIILVDDHSTDPAIKVLFENYEARSGVRIIRSPANQGFVRSATLGFEATENDVVLLNSDTEVTPRWLQKLKIAAYRDPQTATVTPFSNAAGAFSVPEVGVNAAIPFPFTTLKMARLTERLSNRLYPAVPTGNGFCMFIKRQVLREIGGFDAENFGRGYGEENDFCMRATRVGWRHAIDDSLFVYHRGNSSFGEEKQTLLQENRRTLDRLHPTYTERVREFTQSPEINAIRARIGKHLAGGVASLQLEKPRVLFILQEGGGGVPMTNADLVSKISATHECFLLTSTGSQMILRAWENGRLVERQQWKLPGVWSAMNQTNPAAQRVYFEVLTGLGIDLVHIRHLFKHSFDAPILCRQLGLPVVLSFHDYYFVCPSIHLLDQNESFCGGVCTPGLQQCTIPSPMLRDLPMLKEYLPEWRRKVEEILDCCDAFVTTAESVREVHLRAYPQLALKPFWVIEHGREFKPVETAAAAPVPGEPVRILVAGNIDRHKGSNLIRQLKELDREGLLEFHFAGQTDEDIRHIGVHHGTYRRDDFPQLARNIRPAFAAVFSIWAETYSHTLSEAWSAGLPVLGSNLGAVGERIVKHGGGWTVNVTDPLSVLRQIRQITADPAAYQLKVEAAAVAPIHSLEKMADGYRALYERLLAGSAWEHLLHVGSIEPKGDRGSSFVRLRLPFAHEEMRKEILATRFPSELSRSELEKWARRLHLDAIIAQRDVLGREAAARLLDLCRAADLRLILEIDDNLLEIDRSHVEYELYNLSGSGVSYLASEADHVVVSTPRLARSFQRLNARTSVVGNALDEWLWFSPLRATSQPPREKRIVAGYMGTPTHDADLELIREPFLRARAQLRQTHDLDLVLEMIGGRAVDEATPWYKRRKIPKGCSRYPEFVRWLRENVDWDLAFAPLVDNPLNQAKSALKFLEYAALGVPAIFSSIGEYASVVKHRENGLLVSSNEPAEWEELIVELVASPTLRATLSANAMRETKERYLLCHSLPVWKAILKVNDRSGTRAAPPASDRSPLSSIGEFPLAGSAQSH